MFCPDCGLEDRQSNQFCRACGTDLRPVRLVLEKPDNITASAVSARDEIGRAIAAKIRDTQSANELATVTEEVLPEIEKFLESPEERRLRRIRAGTILSSIGLGTAIGISLVSMVMKAEDVIFLAALGLVAFFIGLGFILNGLFLTIPKRSLRDKSSDAESQRHLDIGQSQTNELLMPGTSNLFSSVTEQTTRHLKEKQHLSGD